MKLEVINLTKKYQDKEVLKDINFTFNHGKIYGLLGRNGAGKTTFFNSLNEDIKINSGEFYLEDEFGRNKLKYSMKSTISTHTSEKLGFVLFFNALS